MRNIPQILKTKSAYVLKRYLAARDFLLRNNPGKVLDVGCNNGLFLSLLDNKTEKFGIDLIEENEIKYDGIHYKKHDILNGLPYDSLSFDAVVSLEVVEHMLDTEHFFNECYRVVKHGGSVVISTPNLHYWRNIVEWFKGNQFFFVDYHKNQEGHVRYFCPKSLHNLAEKSGFTNIRTTTTGDWGGNSIVLKFIASFFETFSNDKNLILFLCATKQ
jgi:2-polyprenyl-3-methyl-5-hydroxy-6-metoxy-1,4-benzoquinol methylase